jgi:transcriptional regulator with XRE-family HTH domain
LIENARGLPVPNLKKWRDWNVLTQKELAAKAKVAEATIINIERGENARQDIVRKIAEALGITPQQLLYEEPQISK